jgi:hypothetical protein
MSDFARQAPGQTIEFILLSRPFSNFAFVDQNFGTFSLLPLRRIMSQVRQHAGVTMVKETVRFENARDLREENEDIAVRYGSIPQSNVTRFGFFKTNLASSRDLQYVTPDDFIGYAIIKKDFVNSHVSKTRVYESIIKPSRRENNFIRGCPSWSCNLGGIDFPINGYPYAQQNCMTNVCAHVALRTLAACYHPEGDMTYREMNMLTGWPQESVVQMDHRNRRAGEGSILKCGQDGGLYVDEMLNILKGAGAGLFWQTYTEESAALTPPPFEKYVYGSVESGYPAIIGFQAGPNALHAIPVFGHTFNEDTWVPNAELSYFRVGENTSYVPSESWLSAYVGHDDNWGSNFCVPRNYLRTKEYKNGVESGNVVYVIATVPREVRVSPLRAEVMGVDYLPILLDQIPHSVGGNWLDTFQEYQIRNMLVFRTILVSGASYRDHLRRISDWRSNKMSEEQLTGLEHLRADEKFWMVELSVPELFPANRRKIAEVLIRAEVPASSKRDFNSLLLARLPGCFAIPMDGGPDSAFAFLPNSIEGHVELSECEEESEAPPN